jgi:hypothetical protein
MAVGEPMLAHDLIVVPTQVRPSAFLEASGGKARDRIATVR